MTWKAVCTCGITVVSEETNLYPQLMVCQCGKRMMVTVYADSHETPEEIEDGQFPKEWIGELAKLWAAQAKEANRKQDSLLVNEFIRSIPGVKA